MGRSRLPLELIPKEKSRKITFQKRAMGLKKKTQEISTLCGVDACLIIYGWSSDDRLVEPLFWPSDLEEVKSIVKRYQEHRKEERGLKTLDLSSFFEERTKKIHKEISKPGHQGIDQSKYSTTWDDRLNNLSVDQLRELVNAWGTKLEVIKSRVELLKMNQTLLEGSALMNPNCLSNAGPSTQRIYTQYVSPIDSMPSVSNPIPNPMMTHFNDVSSYNTQYATPLHHPFYYDQTARMLEDPMSNNSGSSACYYQPVVPPPTMPYMPSQMMLNCPHTNLYDFNNFDVNDSKQGIRYG
ncbi:hypothetical protein PVL29_019840 [Vitis rotundifolia]|uniref:MADS-box domain-containing protein n=1 Tax=Vitis rotundifolia TaxID=103349 RepID=A0AA38Z1H5_VITRO|nr:hypothetical protein PVL29_019840 [Vitis rotundifolia]